MQPEPNEGNELRGRFCDEIDSHHYNQYNNNNTVILSSDQKALFGRGGKRRRINGRCDFGFSFHPLQRRSLSSIPVPKRILRLIVLVALFSFAERQHPTNTAKTKLVSSTMVLSLSITAMPRMHSRNAVPFWKCTKQATRNRSRLFSDVDGFFEKGGDMDRLLEELSDQQQQNPASPASVVPGREGWIERLELPPKQTRNAKALSSPSPVEIRTIRGRRLYVKHDDQLRLEGSGISGNKARKMWTLNEFPAQNFPACLVSYGGPQSNSMLALAAVANYKNRQLLGAAKASVDERGEEPNHDGNDNDSDNDNAGSSINQSELPVKFVYYTKKLPRFLRKQPNGNFFRALSLGMELVEVSREEYGDLFEHRSNTFEGERRPPIGLDAPFPGSLWVPQGGAFAPAWEGATKLAQEIYEYWSQEGEDRPLTVCVPGGTCTTALLLHHGLKKLLLQSGAESGTGDDDDDDYNDELDCLSSPLLDIEVVVVPCVGDATYARRQMMSLAAEIGASPGDIPTILQPEPEEGSEPESTRRPRASAGGRRKKYFTFGKPHKTILETFQELQDDYNVVVDLIYGAPSFAILWRHWGQDRETSLLSPDLSFDPLQPLEGREIMYVHSGGLEGINSQLLRYKYEGLVEIKDVQLPGRRNRSKPRKRNKKRPKDE